MPALQREDYAYVHLPSKTGAPRRVHAVDRPGFPNTALARETLCALPLEGASLKLLEDPATPDLCQTCARIQRVRLRTLHEADVLRQIQEEQGAAGEALLSSAAQALERALGALDAWAAAGAYATCKVQEAAEWLERLRRGSPLP